jgi:pilus assembly protein CpaE
MAEKIRVLIVDDIAETRENIKKLLQFEADIEVVDTARTGKEGLELARKHKPNVILMDINMPDMDGIQATRLIVRDVPTSQIVMVSVQQDTDYLRQAMLAGARDFLSKPPSADELINTIRRLGEISRDSERKMVAPATEMTAPGGRARSAGVDGKVVAVFSPKGGAGCTTILANLAIALQSDDVRVVVVDANIQFGDVHVFFNLKGKYNLVSLVVGGDELDEAFMQNVLMAHPSGVKVVLGPPTPEDAEHVSANVGQLKKILEALRHQFHYVLVDTASVLRDVELSVLDVADRIVLVATPDIPTLANVKKFFDLSEKLEYPKDKIMLVLNRMDKRWNISPQSIEENLKHPLKAQIPFDDRTAVNAMNSGVPFVSASRNTPPAQGILELMQKVKEEFAPKEAAPAGDKKTPAKARSSLFDRK